jgi:hypothetical protein
MNNYNSHFNALLYHPSYEGPQPQKNQFYYVSANATFCGLMIPVLKGVLTALKMGLLRTLVLRDVTRSQRRRGRRWKWGCRNEVLR